MTVKALMPVRVNLVAPLAHKATDRHTTDTTASQRDRSGAASPLNAVPRQGGLHSATGLRTPGTATSTTATRTTTTRAFPARPSPSADSLFALLVQAYLDCRRTKRNSASALAFEAQIERNLFDLHEELISGTYGPGRSICFVITRPKPREVWAAEFRDRVVHHLLYNCIAPRFHARFVADSCACIPGRGTLYAARRLESQVRSITENWSRPASYLKCDLANFFVSIDKTVLLAQLRRRIHEPWWMALAETILMHDPRGLVDVQGCRRELDLVPAHKSLFNAPAGHGLPIGNLSSQFFANVLLDDLDQFVKHRLRAPHYVRYVDDFVLLDRDAHWLHEARLSIEQKLAELHLQLNPRKTILQPAARGIDFVGQVIKPWHRTTRKRTLAAALQRTSEAEAEHRHQSANSYFGLLRQASHSHADRARLANVLRKLGHCVTGSLTKTFPIIQEEPNMAHRSRRPHKRHFMTERMAGEAPDALPIDLVINRVSLLTPQERENIMGPRQLALAEFRVGRGSEDHWRELADAFNVGADLVEHQIASDHAATFDAAKAALASVMTRHQGSGSWTLRGEELTAIDLAVFVHQVQLSHCSRGELAHAVRRTAARIRNVLAGQVPAGAHVFTAGRLGAEAAEGQCA